MISIKPQNIRKLSGNLLQAIARRYIDYLSPANMSAATRRYDRREPHADDIINKQSIEAAEMISRCAISTLSIFDFSAVLLPAYYSASHDGIALRPSQYRGHFKIMPKRLYFTYRAVMLASACALTSTAYRARKFHFTKIIHDFLGPRFAPSDAFAKYCARTPKCRLSKRRSNTTGHRHFYNALTNHRLFARH